MAALDTGIHCAQLSTFSSWETPKQKGSLKPEAKQNVALLHRLNFWVMWALYRWLGQQGSWGRSRKMVPSVIVIGFFLWYWTCWVLAFCATAVLTLSFFLPEYSFSFYYYLCLCVYKCRHAYAHMCIYVHIYTWPGGLVCICINSIWILKLKVSINFISQCQLKCLFYGKRMMLAPDQGPSASSWEPLTFQRSLQRCYLKKKNRKSPVLREIKRSGPTAEGTDSLGEEKGKKKKSNLEAEDWTEKEGWVSQSSMPFLERHQSNLKGFKRQ